MFLHFVLYVFLLLYIYLNVVKVVYYLNAAEALNEAKGPEAAYDYVNQVRARVGMPAYKGMTKEQHKKQSDKHCNNQ